MLGFQAFNDMYIIQKNVGGGTQREVKDFCLEFCIGLLHYAEPLFSFSLQYVLDGISGSFAREQEKQNLISWYLPGFVVDPTQGFTDIFPRALQIQTEHLWL